MDHHLICKACGSLCVDHWCSPTMIFSDGKKSPSTLLYKCPNCGSYNKNLDENWKDLCSQNYTSSYEASPYVGLPKGSHLNRIKDTISHFNLNLQDPDMNYHILDYGMGKGDFSKYILHYYPSLKVFGYDLFPQELENSLISNPNFSAINSYDDLQNNSYDAISLIQAFEHLVDPITTLNNLAKYLKKDGRIILQFPTVTFNPIDLVVYDHTCHYTYSFRMLEGLQSQLNFKSNINCNISNGKEMLISIRLSSDSNSIKINTSPSVDQSIYEDPSKILDSFIHNVIEISSKQPFYILGTTYKSKWICKVLGCSFSNMIEVNIQNHLQYDKNRVLIMPFPQMMAKNIATQFGFRHYVCLK